MKKYFLIVLMVLAVMAANAQSPKVSQLPQARSATDAQIDSADVVANVAGVTSTVKGARFRGIPGPAGDDSLAYHTMVQLDSTHILICNLFGTCDTIELITSGAADLTASNGVKRVADNFMLVDTSEGAGDKFQWLTAMHAFRTGSASGTQNNVANIGDYSFAHGQNNIASGYGSICIGLNNVANTTLATCIGQNNTSESGNGFAVGSSNYVTGTASVVMGSSNRATGNNSLALGVSTNADAYGSTATGFTNRAKSFGSFIAGYYNDSTQRGNANLITTTGVIFAIGNGTNASNRHSSLEMIGSGWMKVDGTTSNTVAASVLDVRSTVSGFLPPRMTKAQRDAITSPPDGSVIFQTDNTPGIRVYSTSNVAWMKFTETAD